MTQRVVWLRVAMQARREQLDYIRGENPGAAAEQGDRIAEQSRHLAEHPNMGRTGRVPGTRELVIQRTPFVLVYRVIVEAQRVEVLRLLHGSQQWPPE